MLSLPNGYMQLALPFLMILLAGTLFPPCSSSTTTTRRFHFNVKWKTVTRLCHTKQLLTVNGQFPGPTVAVHEGDNVEIKVTNLVSQNTTIHWHGIRQYRTGWADGPAYITQCPIRTGESYTYKFKVVDQRGTLLWHAHHSWQRASVYGELWNADVDAVEIEMTKTGGGPNSSDAYTINGLPGPLYPCSTRDTFIQTVERGKTYMLRIINAALNAELFFAIENHTLTVVETDAVYTKPYRTKSIMIAPGQTASVLLHTDQVPNPIGTFLMAATPYVTSVFPFDNSTTLGYLRYKNTRKKYFGHFKVGKPRNTPKFHNLPGMLDTDFATKFSRNINSLNSQEYPCRVPKKIDKRVISTISLNLQDCPKNNSCGGYGGKRYFASMNNISFVRPSVSILESYYKNQTDGVFSLDFPDRPRKEFDYTGVDPLSENMNTKFGTKLFEVAYGARIEIVLQGTGFLNTENHPIHVHGHNFFVVGTGFGNFDVEIDPLEYNLVDPPERNTVAVPTGGWAAIRINADNPGVWFVHCHLEEHTSWGLAMGFIVRNGPLSSQTMLPPPRDFPQC